PQAPVDPAGGGRAPARRRLVRGGRADPGPVTARPAGPGGAPGARGGASTAPVAARRGPCLARPAVAAREPEPASTDRAAGATSGRLAARSNAAAPGPAAYSGTGLRVCVATPRSSTLPWSDVTSTVTPRATAPAGSVTRWPRAASTRSSSALASANAWACP